MSQGRVNSHHTLSCFVHSTSLFGKSNPYFLVFVVVLVVVVVVAVREAHIMTAPAKNIRKQTILIKASSETRRLGALEIITASSSGASLSCFPSSTSTGAYSPFCTPFHHLALKSIAADRIIGLV